LIHLNIMSIQKVAIVRTARMKGRLDKMKHYAWLKSIRTTTHNGYLSDEDCYRIEEYFKKQVKKTVEKMWLEVKDGNNNG